jgi:UDP-glucose 4-epimerase
MCDALLLGGNTVVALDNMSLGCESNLRESAKSGSFALIKGDVLDYSLLSSLFREYNFSTVFHFAANSDIARSCQNPTADLNNTFMTTYNILRAMRENGSDNLVFSSTSAIYGDAVGVAVAEDYGPLLPKSHYGAGKLASEAFISSFVENYGLRAWIIRFPNVCGERTTHGILHDFVKKLKNNPQRLEVLGDGRQTKPYIYVKDLIEAILFVCGHSSDRINVFNVGADGQTSVAKIADIVIKNMALKAEIVFTGGAGGWVGDVPRFAYSLNKIHALGWKSKMSSDEAVDKAVKNILEYDLCNL